MLTSPLVDLMRICAPLAASRSGRRDSLTIVHLVPSLGWGGAERLACTMHRLALQAGLRSRIDAPGLPALRDGIAVETGLAMAPRPEETSLRSWALAARRRVRESPPDVVHAHLPFPDRYSAALVAARGRPLVATFQLLPEPGRSWSPDELLGRRSDRVLAALSRIRRGVRLVAVSQSDHERLAALVPTRLLARIANGPPLARLRLPDLAAPPWPAGRVRLLSIGRLHRQKGLDRTLRALSAPPLRAGNWHWLVAGDGPEHDRLLSDAMARGLGDRVTVLPTHPASALYPTADLVLCASRSEGMPLVPIEAVEAGVPVLASDIPAHREIFRAVPQTLFSADEAAWPSSLAALVSSPAARRALAEAQRAALPRDPRAAMWEAYTTLYRSMATS